MIWAMTVSRLSVALFHFCRQTKKLPLLRVDSSCSFASAKLLYFQEIYNT